MISYIDIVRPSSKSSAHVYDAFCIFAGSVFLALMAQFSLRVWFTPIPLSLQTFAVLMLGALLGSKRGALAVMAYLMYGACGLPVFASGSAGIVALFGPSGGFFIGFVLAAFTIGFLLERGWKESYLLTFLALIAGEIVLFALGTAWLAFFVGAKHALAMGLLPFIIGDTLKVCVAAALIPAGWKYIK